jgi:putative effector of murein hydrolase
MVAITPPRRPVFAQAQQTADAPLTAVLAGRVLDALSGAPVGSVTVRLFGLGHALPDNPITRSITRSIARSITRSIAQ